MSDIKKQILNWIEEIDKFKVQNTECSEALNVVKENGIQIAKIYPIIHNEEYNTQEEMHELMMQISILAEEKRQAESTVKRLMSEKFSEFKKKYSKIYELAVSEEGIDPETLNHVLDTYVKYKAMNISEPEGKNQGIDFMQRKFDLPDGFLEHVPE